MEYTKLLSLLFFVFIQLVSVSAAPVNVESLDKRTYVYPDYISYLIYFQKPESWGDDIYSYVYTDDADTLALVKDNSTLVDWPGRQLEKLSNGLGYYIYYPQYLYDHSRIIFTDGTNQSPDVLQEGFNLVKNALYTVDGVSGIVYDYDKNGINYENAALIYYHPTYASYPATPEVYVHYQIDDGEWKDLLLSRNPYTNYFIKYVPLGDGEEITFCFTDGEVWDNNSSKNYKFKKNDNIYLKSDVKFFNK